MNLHIYGPQVIIASNTFCVEPTSKIAKETFEYFCEMWRYLISDVIQVAKDILESFKIYPLPYNITNGGVNPAAVQNQGGKLQFTNNHLNQHFGPPPALQDGHGGGYPRPRTSDSGGHYNNEMPPPRLNNNMPPSRNHPLHYNPALDRGPPDGMPYRNETVWGGENYGPYINSRQGGYNSSYSSRSGMTTAHEIFASFKDVGDENEILKRARGMLANAQGWKFISCSHCQKVISN